MKYPDHVLEYRTIFEKSQVQYIFKHVGFLVEILSESYEVVMKVVSGESRSITFGERSGLYSGEGLCSTGAS